MPFFYIFMMTSLAIIAFVWLIASSQHSNLYSLRNLFLAVWLYYGFSIGIDLISGVELRWTRNEVHLGDPSNWNSVAFVMWNFALCGVTFLVSYYLLLGNHQSKAIDLDYDLRTPHEWVLIAIHVLATYLFVQVFFGMDRMERIAISQQSVAYKFATLVVPLTLAVDVLVILCSKGSKAVVAWGLGVFLALMTGNRNYVLFIFLVGAFHWRPALRGWKLLGMATSCAFVIFAFKTLYAVGLVWWMGEQVSMAMIYDNLRFTLSGLDADASYLIAVFYTGEPSPWWFGKSYIQTPILLAWPRFLGGTGVTTLAEDYIWAYHPATAERGGAMAFSAIAEAWLNFSYVGAMILGAFWGVVAGIFDRRPRGISFYIVLLMIARLFRSDAASLFKNWVLVWGTLFVLAITLLTIYTVATERRQAGKSTYRKSSRPTLGVR